VHEVAPRLSGLSFGVVGGGRGAAANQLIRDSTAEEISWQLHGDLASTGRELEQPIP
jgi:hypothetical protein